MNIFYISYFSPPLLNVGANRSKRFTTAFKEEGHHVTVFREGREHRFVQPAKHYAQPTSNVIFPVRSWNIDWVWKIPTVIHKQYHRYWRGIKSKHDGNIAQKYWYIDMHWGWICPVLYAAWKHSQQSKPDVIVVSCPPFSSAWIGCLLSKWLNVPLVLDFRDAWSQASYFVEKNADKHEQRVLKYADALVVTSSADYYAYRQLFPQKRIYYIPNSYDRILDHASGDAKALTIAYSGTWDGFRRSAKGIFSQLARCDFPVRFIHIGDIQEDMVALIETYKLSDVVTLIERQPKDKLHHILSQCDVLFIQKGKPDHGCLDTHLATKAIDYVASGKPILAELPEGETVNFLRRYATQLYEVTPDAPHAYAQQLKQLYQRWHDQTLKAIKPSDAFFHDYYDKKLARDFMQVLDDVKAYATVKRVEME